MSALDEEIECQSELVDLLALEYKGYSQRIFSQQLRFKDENGEDYPEWEEKKLGEVGEIVTGSTPSRNQKEYWYPSEIPWISVSDFDGKYINKTELSISKKGGRISRLIPKNSVLVNCIGAIGKMSMTTATCATNQQINAFIANDSLDPNFAYYAIQANIGQLNRLTTRSVLSQVNKTSFSSMIISFPNLSEQQKISGFLSSLDNKLEIERTFLLHLREQKKSYLQRLFP